MKIEDYDFHKKFQYFIKYCKPNQTYCLNDTGIHTYNMLRKECGWDILPADLLIRISTFKILGGEVITAVRTTELSGIIDVETFIRAINHLSFSEILLDTKNLRQL